MIEILVSATVMLTVGIVIGLICRPMVLPTAPTETIDRDQVKTLLQSLQKTAVGLLENVDEHSRTIDVASDEIISAVDSDPNPLNVVLIALKRIAEANQRMKQKLQEAEHTIRQQSQLLQLSATEARTDSLTSLPNRRAFDEKLKHVFGRENGSQSVSVLLLDIDHFKDVNDAHGHDTGDAVLRGVAQLLGSSVRSGDLAARYGGEEFALLLPGTGGEDAQRRAEEIRARVATSVFRCGSQDIRVTVSAGCAQRLPTEHSEELMKRADSALYDAKKVSRNRVCYHDGDQTVQISRSAPPASKIYRLTTSSQDQPEPVASSNGKHKAPAS